MCPCAGPGCEDYGARSWLPSKPLISTLVGCAFRAYKVVGQRRVVGIVNLESHDELDRIATAGLPMAHVLEVEELLPVREYSDFADDVKRRWK